MPFAVWKFLNQAKEKLGRIWGLGAYTDVTLKHYSCFGRFCSKEEKNYKEKQTAVQTRISRELALNFGAKAGDWNLVIQQRTDRGRKEFVEIAMRYAEYH